MDRVMQNVVLVGGMADLVGAAGQTSSISSKLLYKAVVFLGGVSGRIVVRVLKWPGHIISACVAHRRRLLLGEQLNPSGRHFRTFNRNPSATRFGKQKRKKLLEKEALAHSICPCVANATLGSPHAAAPGEVCEPRR